MDHAAPIIGAGLALFLHIAAAATRERVFVPGATETRKIQTINGK